MKALAAPDRGVMAALLPQRLQKGTARNGETESIARTKDLSYAKVRTGQKRMNIEVREAFAGPDLSAVQELCRSFRQWLYERYSPDRQIIDRYYNPRAFEALLADLPVLHARPDGTILLAKAEGVPCGCIMMSRLDEEICEMKRLFVNPECRRGGVGRALCEVLFTLARQRGYRLMRLDTGSLHHEAIQLYERLGFVIRDPYYDPGYDTKGKLIFMEKALLESEL